MKNIEGEGSTFLDAGSILSNSSQEPWEMRISCCFDPENCPTMAVLHTEGGSRVRAYPNSWAIDITSKKQRQKETFWEKRSFRIPLDFLNVDEPITCNFTFF